MILDEEGCPVDREGKEEGEVPGGGPPAEGEALARRSSVPSTSRVSV